MRAGVLALVMLVVGLVGCATAHGDDGTPVPDLLTLSGAVLLPEPVDLPADAVLTVILEDVSRADAPAATLAQTNVLVHTRQTKVPFALVYPSSAVLPGSTYAARARVTLGDQLLFTTTERNQIDALHPAPVELTLTAVPAPTAPPVPDVSLTDTYWKLTEVDGRPVEATDTLREPNLVLNGQDRRFAGSGGVNRLMGGYTLDGGSLVFTNPASTMMAGPPEAMQQEQAILTTLPLVGGFSIRGDQLTLTDSAGRPLLRAVAVALN